MHLESLEILGFKSFAKKTKLVFPKGITCIVGPNGCGKSNITDCIRWILGEQSLKNLRAGKNEDLIFSAGNKRLGLSQASLVVKNEKNEETEITRRFFRNGENEYLINNKKIKREDLLFYLAKENIGQKSYSILSQGMVDWILYSSKQERKDFFDEATGIREHQIKKNKAISKIKKGIKNLDQAEIAIKEVEPRMRFLSRQIKKWEKRQEIEKSLIELEKKYYGARLFKFKKEKNKIIEQFNEKQLIFKKEEKELKDFQVEFGSLASYQPSDDFKKIQNKWQNLLGQKNKLLEEQTQNKTNLIIKKEDKIIEEKNLKDLEKPLKKLFDQEAELLKKIENVKEIEEVKNLKGVTEKMIVLTKEMLSFFGQPINEVEDKNDSESIVDDLKNDKLVALNQEIGQLENKLNNFFELENQKRKEMLEVQKKLQVKQDKVSSLGYELKDVEMEKVRLETKEEDLKDEIKKEAFNKELDSFQEIELSYSEEEDLFMEINKLKREMDLIGGFDESFLQEYNECRDKYDFLSSQINDLKNSIGSLENVRKKLDEQIRKEFFVNFNKINKYFEEYFKFLFKGGSAKLVLEEENDSSLRLDNNGKDQKDENQEMEEDDQEESKEIKYGVEIYARPPQKKNKTVQSLSGGEKALTSIALICAVLKTENPPFVVLDEVDAALDEANSVRLAEIIKELSKNIQSIVVTHNPVSMEVASALYGVTIDKESSSHVVSMKLE